MAACVSAGAPDAVVEALRVHASDEAVAENACCALANLAAHDAGKAACLSASAPNVVIAALRAHTSDRAIAEQVRRAVINLAESDAGRAACVSAGAPRAVVAARAHASDRAPFTAALHALE